MSSPFASLDARLRRLPDPFLLAIGLALIAALTVLGTRPDHGMPLDDFYFIPVAAVGWLARSRSYGYASALVAAVGSVAMALDGPTAVPLGSAITAGVARLALYLVVLSLLTGMRRMQREHEREARTDPLTGAANARAFRALAQTEVERSQRYEHELSLAYLDIDDFKAINDRAGHADGDHVLMEVSLVMQRAVRSIDTVARLGGDEFAILMPESGAPEARALVDRLRRDLASLTTNDGRPVLCSIGLVTFECPPASLQELIAAGDELMYKAKHSGKDRIEQAERAGSYANAAPSLRVQDHLAPSGSRGPRRAKSLNSSGWRG